MGDYTGRAIIEVLTEKVRTLKHIQIFEHYALVDVVTSHQIGFKGYPRVLGVIALSRKDHDLVFFQAPVVVLATGGVGRLYRYTTNWQGATGDGIACAFRAGCRVGNMEFIQFHPTLLYHEKSRNFLISEALRGEGGRIINAEGRSFASISSHGGFSSPRYCESWY